VLPVDKMSVQAVSGLARRRLAAQLHAADVNIIAAGSVNVVSRQKDQAG
jgi:hypothetical protein